MRSLVFVCSLLLLSVHPSSFALTFLAYGDMPYGLFDRWVMDGWAENVAADDSRFVINVGDLGRPEVACSDDWLLFTRKYWTKFNKPVFYTPGDNDWTDCDRTRLPSPVSEVARLQALRKIMYADMPVLAAEWRYQQQASYPENQRWQLGGVWFATLHMVGTANGRREIVLDNPQVVRQLVDARDEANLTWLAETVALAQQNKAQALVIAFQADVKFDNCLAHPAYHAFCERIKQVAVEFANPILLIHGDSRPYCLDNPWGVKHLWRLNLAGDGVDSDIARIYFDAESKTHPFSVYGLSAKQRPDASCR